MYFDLAAKCPVREIGEHMYSLMRMEDILFVTKHPAVEQATARYQAGLGNIDAVAEAQRLVTQAEIDDALARLNVWRGLLALAVAAGDIRPFLAEVSR